MIKAAVIGAGNIGRIHTRIYAEHSDVRLVAVVDHHHERALSLASPHGASIFQDAESMLREVRPDVVSIAVPIDQLYPTAALLIRHGVHTLIEKPMALNAADGAQLVALAAQHEVVAAVGYSECFNPAAEALRQVVASNRLGAIREFHARRLSPPPHQMPAANVIYDLLGHDLCLLRTLFPHEFVSLEKSASVLGASGMVEGFSGLFRLSSGVTGSIEANRSAPEKLRTWSLTGENGTVQCDLLHRKVTLQCREQPVESIPVHASEPLASEIADFLSAVQNRHLPRVPAALGVEVLELLDAASRSVNRLETGL